jgi:hypothetical protein
MFLEDLSAGLLLGLSSGAYCLGGCALVMVPHLASGPSCGVGAGLRKMVEFSAGRLVTYLVAGVLLFWVGQALLLSRGARIVIGMTIVALAFLVLAQGAAALRARRRVLAVRLRRAAGVAVPDRDAVPPPQLATNTPVADILHPVQVNFGEVLRDNPDTPVFNNLDGWFCQRLHPDKPLRACQRLDNGGATLTMTYGVTVILDFNQ